eukprot:SAG22_NODE_86_length_21440_cov_288.248700_3_plen_48_part_00
MAVGERRCGGGGGAQPDMRGGRMENVGMVVPTSKSVQVHPRAGPGPD